MNFKIEFEKENYELCKEYFILFEAEKDIEKLKDDSWTDEDELKVIFEKDSYYEEFNKAELIILRNGEFLVSVNGLYNDFAGVVTKMITTENQQYFDEIRF